MKLFNQKKSKAKSYQKLKFKKKGFFTKERFLPVAIIFGMIGSYLVFQSFAATPLMLGSDGEYNALTPSNVLDTRSGNGGYTGVLPANQTYSVQIAGKGGVPDSLLVKSVVLNLTSISPSSNGYITAWPSGVTMPSSSNLNFTANQTIANQVTVPVGTDGKIQIFSSATTHVTVDVAGYYSNELGQHGSRFNSLVPFRALDSRSGIGGLTQALGKDGTYSLQLAGVGGVPQNGVTAVVFNLTAVKPSTEGYATAYPSGATRPNTASINFMQGKTVAKLVTVPIGPDGKVTLYSSTGLTHYVVDVAGYYDGSVQSGDTNAQAGRFVSVNPSRVMDTRNGTGGYSAALPANKTYTVQIAGKAGLPSTGIRAVVLNVAAVSPMGDGFLTLWPAATYKPTVSNINFVTGQTIANQAIVKVGANGTVQITSPVNTHVIIDVAGYFVEYPEVSAPITSPVSTTPPSTIAKINRNVISFNGCTANYVRNEDDSILGVVTAKHCLNNVRETLWKGNATYQTGASLDIPKSKMIIDPTLDIIYFGLNNVLAKDVKQQMLDNLNLANLSSVGVNTKFVMSGFPYYNNPDKSVETLNLSYGGIARWNQNYEPFILTFGNWVNNVSCSNRASGSGGYLIRENGEPLLIGVLTDHGEFSPVLTMPYTQSAGLGHRTNFENQLGRKIQSQYMCGFEAPIQV